MDEKENNVYNELWKQDFFKFKDYKYYEDLFCLANKMEKHFREDNFEQFFKFLLENAKQKDLLMDSLDSFFVWFMEHSDEIILLKKKKMFEEELLLKFEFRNFTKEEKELLHYLNVVKRAIKEETFSCMLPPDDEENCIYKIKAYNKYMCNIWRI